MAIKYKRPITLVMMLLAAFSHFVHALDLTLSPDDLLIENRTDGSLHLFIRKKPDINSVLLVESTRDPAMQEHNFSFRAGEWNPINGNEIRLLNNTPIPAESRIFSLVSSTVINHEVLGAAFHIYIPHVLYYGFPPGRHGRVYVTDGLFFNIRTFNLAYANYLGDFRDNPFVLEARQRLPITPERVEPQAPVIPERVEQPIPLLPAPANMLPATGHRIGIEELMASIRQIDFSWSPVSGANAYIFTLQQEINGWRQTILTVTVSETNWRLDNINVLYPGTFYWQVEAVNKNEAGIIQRRGVAGENSFVLDVPAPGPVFLEDPGVLYGN